LSRRLAGLLTGLLAGLLTGLLTGDRERSAAVTWHLVTSVRIVTDSACDLPAEVADELGIEIVPLSIRFGSEEFIDREQLTVAEFWSRCANASELPETAAPAPGQFETVYRRLAAEGTTGIVVVSLSGALSATIQSAELAARTIAADDSVDVDIRVVDSRTVTLGIGTIALASARAARDGATVDEVEALATDLAQRTRVIGALDTLENLKKGGRIGNAKALLATALSIKPIIEVVDGIVEQGGKQRTRSKALKHLVDKVSSYQGRIDDLAVLHADCSDVDEFVEMLQPFYDGEIVVGEIGPVIGSHGGPGTIGVAFHELT
jgi:DegV family protein with EDD domain